MIERQIHDHQLQALIHALTGREEAARKSACQAELLLLLHHHLPPGAVRDAYAARVRGARRNDTGPDAVKTPGPGSSSEAFGD